MKLKRRTFLKIAAASCVGAAAVGGGIFMVGSLDPLKRLKAGFADAVIKRYGKASGEPLLAKVFQEFQALSASLPDLGPTEENRWATNMPPAALGLAAYRVLVPKYANLEEVGQILYETAERAMGGLASIVMRVMYSESSAADKLRLLATRSQHRQYPDDWVMTFVDGKGEEFHYGVDVTECAIQKYLTAHGAPELTRYLCLTDQVISDVAAKGLVRTKTLAEGCEFCDFRFKQGRSTCLYPLRDGWPPKFAICGG